MKMELDYDSLLDIALGGPEIGPLNLVTLHGLLREVFKQSGISKREIVVDEEDPIFGNAFNFIQSKAEKRPRTAGGGYGRLRSRVSVIVGDYARSPIGVQQQPPPSSGEEKMKLKTSKILPADVEDRLKFIESELKIVKNFPSVDELRTWASEKTSPDTIVTDLWHFVSLNHRMNGAEEGIQKLTELVDKLIPELKKLNDEQSNCQGQIDDLYSQLRGLSDRANRLSEDVTGRTKHLEDRMDSAVGKAEKTVEQLQKEIKEINDKLAESASLQDLEDFVLRDVFLEEKDKARLIADQINEEMSTKAPLSMLTNLPDNSDLKRLTDDIHKIRDQMDDMDIYVKWPQLEDAISISPGSSCPISGRSSDARNSTGSRPVSARIDSRPVSGSSTGNRNSSEFTPPSKNWTDNNGNNRFRQHRSSRSSNPSVKQERYQPSENVIKRLNELGMLAERQNDLMDALERTREQLALKADKKDLEGLLTDGTLNELLNLIRDVREDLKGIQNWRELIEEERLPEFRKLMKNMDEQASNMLKMISELNKDSGKKQKAVDVLYTFIDRLEENKLDRDDPMILQLTKNLRMSKDQVDGPLDNKAYDSMIEQLKTLSEALQGLNRAFSNMEKIHGKDMTELRGDMEEKLDRSELQPLREYLENRYNVLSQQQSEHEGSGCKHVPTPPSSAKHKSNIKTSPSNGISISHTINHDIAPTTLIGKGVGLGCSHPNYGEGFVPHKNAAAVRTQMKFNCLSCDRPLTMQTNSAFQTIRGRPLNAYELDQLRLLQRILKGEKLHGDNTRPCGGKHTSTKTIKSRPSTSKSMPVIEYGYDEDDLIDGEVDIEGIDGRLYKGLISKKDLKRHLRSKSANANLRTVSPRSKTPNVPTAGKSLDFCSSFSSGLGTTHGSMDIQIGQ